MSAIDEAIHLLPNLSRSEKAQLLQWVARDLGNAFAGIEILDAEEGSEAFIRRTRIPVWLLEQSRRLGMSEADLLTNYPGLRAEDLVNAWAYVSANRPEIDEQINENEKAA